MSNWIIPVVVLTTKPRIYQRIEKNILAPQILLTPATKEVAADMASGGAWVNRNPQQVSRTGVNRITPGENFNAVSV